MQEPLAAERENGEDTALGRSVRGTNRLVGAIDASENENTSNCEGGLGGAENQEAAVVSLQQCGYRYLVDVIDAASSRTNISNGVRAVSSDERVVVVLDEHWAMFRLFAINHAVDVNSCVGSTKS